MSEKLPSFAAGALFGSSLLASGVYRPDVITSQMNLTNFHMLQTFLIASASSVLVVRAAQRAGYAPCAPRAPAGPLGLFPYDANAIGGLMIGTGMTLTGACPGTVLVQIATGIRSGMLVGAGGLLGGLIYTALAPSLNRVAAEPQKSTTTAKAAPASRQDLQPPVPTIASLLKTNPTTVLLAYEILVLLMAFGSASIAPQAPHWLSPIVGGVLIGAAQAASVLLTRKTVGVSTAYHDLGRRIWRLVTRGARYPTAQLSTPALLFALGVIAGSAILARSPAYMTAAGSLSSTNAAPIPDLTALLGGVVMVAGAGLAGGCPSGHGISGMASFGVASFVSVAAMFGGGIAVALALK